MPGRLLLIASTPALTLCLGLLQHLDDCGSPPLETRAPALTRPTSLKTSDHRSMMAYLGLPLDLFGKVSGVVGIKYNARTPPLRRTLSFSHTFPYNN